MNKSEACHFCLLQRGDTLIRTIQLLAENVKNKFNSTNMKHNLLRPFLKTQATKQAHPPGTMLNYRDFSFIKPVLSGYQGEEREQESSHVYTESNLIFIFY